MESPDSAPRALAERMAPDTHHDWQLLGPLDREDRIVGLTFEVQKVLDALRNLPDQYVVGGGAEMVKVVGNGWEHRCVGVCARTVDGVTTNVCPHTWIEAWAMNASPAKGGSADE